MQRQKGFTLVEAAIAIGVVAILSGIIIPLVIKNLRDARVARARNDLMVIAGAIAHQLKDTGTRPRAAGAAGGVAAPTGAGNAFWFSEGQIFAVGGGPLAVAGDNPPGAIGQQNFHNLFALAANNPIGNTLFGFGAPADGAEFGYRGPYLADDVADKADPWGTAYVVLGYNQEGQASDGPIWVVSAGESRTITAVNLNRAVPGGGAAAHYQPLWNYGGLSATNIAIRVH